MTPNYGYVFWIAGVRYYIPAERGQESVAQNRANALAFAMDIPIEQGRFVDTATDPDPQPEAKG